MNDANPLLSRWTGPYGGVPPFDRVEVRHFRPALAASIETYRRELEGIGEAQERATFENTIGAMEKAGRTFHDAVRIFYVWSSAMNGPEFQEVERDLAPKLAAFDDEITQNPKLFARIAEVYEAREHSGLTPEQVRLTWLLYTGFVRSGAKLEAAGKARMGEINQRLASLYTQFSQNVLADEERLFLTLDSEAQLAGLPQSLREGAAADAEARGLAGKWVISNTRSSVEPFLTYASTRELRQKVFALFVSRGDNGDARDTKKLIAEILELRRERAKLLGYPTHAHWRLEQSMAKTPERAMALLEATWGPAVARVAEEVADMQAIADREGGGIRIEPWDYRYYAEKVRKAKYDLDENELMPYLQLETLREGMFWVAGELFGLEFVPVSDVPVYHPEMRVYEVRAREGGRHLGLWYFDPYARSGKHSGAWMSAYREQSRIDGEVATLVSNNANFVKARPGEPVLISWDDARTLFHEFGHALHGLSSSVTYPSLSGTSVARDFVEFPSQLLEHWLLTPEVLNRFARHHQTGEPMPGALLQKVKRAATFNQGFATVEYLSSALIDLRLHLEPEGPIDPAAYERQTLKALGMPREVVMRHRTPQFSHVFSGDGYSAGYYSYLWADTLVADAWEAFEEAGGPWDRATAARLLEHVLAVGNTVDPAESYRAFRGRDAGVEPLMRKRGFSAPGEA